MTGPGFFFLRGWVERDLKFIPLFPTYSHHVPKGSQVFKCVPLDVPNNTWVLSHMVFPKFNFYGYKLKR
jgi:hypothetical protein